LKGDSHKSNLDNIPEFAWGGLRETTKSHSSQDLKLLALEYGCDNDWVATCVTWQKKQCSRYFRRVIVLKNYSFPDTYSILLICALKTRISHGLNTQQREQAGHNLFLSRSQLLDIGITYRRNKKVSTHVRRFLNIQKKILKKWEREETRT